MSRQFTTGPVAGFLVDDVLAATEALRSAGTEIVLEPELDEWGTPGCISEPRTGTLTSSRMIPASPGRPDPGCTSSGRRGYRGLEVAAFVGVALVWRSAPAVPLLGLTAWWPRPDRRGERPVGRVPLALCWSARARRPGGRPRALSCIVPAPTSGRPRPRRIALARRRRGLAVPASRACRSRRVLR